MEEQLKEIVSLLEDIRFGLTFFASIFVGFLTLILYEISHKKVDKKRK